MLAAGANVFAADISTAVEANHKNCNKHPNYFVCQTDILNLPVLPEQFDIVVCIGVIQHTPDPEETMKALCTYLKPGGLLIIDHYSRKYPVTPSRRLLRAFLFTRSKSFSMTLCKALVSILWPLHRMLWKAINLRGLRQMKWLRKGRSLFLYLSPVVDYQDAYPQLGSDLLYKWSVLDTYDTLTDYYKHLRNADEIIRHLEQCGMVDIIAEYAGNGVEARARKALTPNTVKAN